MKNKVLTIVLCGFITFMLTGCFNNRNYELKLPEQDDIKSISLTENDREIEITNREELELIISILSNNGEERTTSEESIQDYPVNAEDIIKIDFNFREKGASTLFIYKKDKKRFIEVPYNGIYKISEDEYNSIEKYIEK